MKVETLLFGPVEVDPDKVLIFPEGLSGFEASKRYMLIHESADGSPVSYTLQSLEDPALAFRIADPTAFDFHYELALTDAERTLLKDPAPEEVAVMLVLYRQEEAKDQLGANYRAPLLINTKARVGLQKVITQPRRNVIISNLASEV